MRPLKKFQKDVEGRATSLHEFVASMNFFHWKLASKSSTIADALKGGDGNASSPEGFSCTGLDYMARTAKLEVSLLSLTPRWFLLQVRRFSIPLKHCGSLTKGKTKKPILAVEPSQNHNVQWNSSLGWSACCSYRFCRLSLWDICCKSIANCNLKTSQESPLQTLE